LIQDDARRCRIGIFGALTVCFGGAVTLVHFKHGQVEAAVQLACKFFGLGRVLVGRAIGVIRHAHHQRVRLPFGNTLGDELPTGIAFGVDGGLRLSLAQQAAAVGHACTFDTEVKGKERLKPL
jgi:hypothetical protein